MMIFQRKTAAFNFAVAFAIAAATPDFLPRVEARTRVKSKENAKTIAARKALVSCYARYDAAMEKGDVDTQMSFIAPDYEHYTLAGFRQDRATFEQQSRSMWSSGLPIRIEQIQTKIQSFQWRGPDAVVVVERKLVMKANAKKSKSGVARFSERHYWSPNSTGWKLRQVVEIKADDVNFF